MKSGSVCSWKLRQLNTKNILFYGFYKEHIGLFGCLTLLEQRRVKAKVLPVQATKALRVGRANSSTQFKTSILKMGVGGQRHAPAALPPEKTRYPLYSRLDGPQGRSGRVRKFSPLPTGIRYPRTVQPVASRYSDWAVAAARTVANSTQFYVSYTCSSWDTFMGYVWRTRKPPVGPPNGEAVCYFEVGFEFESTFLTLRKLSVIFIMSVRLSSWNNSAPSGRIFKKCDVWESVEEIRFTNWQE